MLGKQQARPPRLSCSARRAWSEGPELTRSGNPSSYKAVIEANESGRPAVEKLEPFYPGLVVIVAVRGSHLKGGFCTPHVPV